MSFGLGDSFGVVVGVLGLYCLGIVFIFVLINDVFLVFLFVYRGCNFLIVSWVVLRNNGVYENFLKV